MALDPHRPCYIVVGPEDPDLLEDIKKGLAPRLDYRLVAERLDASIVQCAPSPAALRGHKVMRVLRSMASNFQAALQLISRIPDDSIIYSTGETWGVPIALALKLTKRSCTHVIYAHRVFSSTWLRLLRGLRSLMHVDGWICVTSHQAGLICEALGKEAPPVISISQGVDTLFFDPELSQPSSSSGYVLSVGAEMRNYALLIEAVQNMPAKVVIKASSAWMTELRSDLQSLPPNISLRTERLSYIELRDLYAHACLIVVPLRDTPQAAGITTILEAMAMNRCVVATRSSGLPGVLIDGQTGLIVEPVANALSDTIAELLDAPQQRAKLAQTAKQLVLNSVSIDEHARQVTTFLTSTSKKNKL